MDPYIGEIRLLPYPFAPEGWFDCDGRLLETKEHPVLFGLIGTTYGGDGDRTFALPDLRGRVPVHKGPAPGGRSNYLLGQAGGSESVALYASHSPAHSHPAMVTSGTASTGTPGGGVELGAATGEAMYTDDIASVASAPLNPQMISKQGGGRPHDNMMPTLAVRYCIAFTGIRPHEA